jgi:ornithine carbamoyltransferase
MTGTGATARSVVGSGCVSVSVVVVEEAANRMHVQKGLLAWLLGQQS